MATKEAAYTRFILARKSDFSRIAHRTQGEYSADDLAQEVWLLVDSIEGKLGRPIDFDSPSDQRQVLGWVFNQCVKYCDKTIRSAIKLDKYWEDEESDFMSHVFDGMMADNGADPFKQLLAAEEIDEFWDAVLKSYSQLTAYIILLDRVGGAQKDLAEYLAVVLGTLRRRLQRAKAHTLRQPSLFDGVQKIGLDFLPLIARGFASPMSIHLIGNQYEWSF